MIRWRKKKQMGTGADLAESIGQTRTEVAKAREDIGIVRREIQLARFDIAGSSSTRKNRKGHEDDA